jgi:DNA-binding response OmpR family regulator
MKGRVLIIDDEKMIGSLLDDFLSENEYETQVCLNLSEARAALKSGTLPELIVLDVMLPDGNGMDFLRELRSSPITERIPIVMMTAHRIDTQDRIKGFNEGADDYISKPFDLHEFKSRIERLLRRVGTPPIRPTPIAAPPVSISKFEDALKEVIKKKPETAIASLPTFKEPKASAKKKSLPLRTRLAQLLLEPGQFFHEQTAPEVSLGLGIIGVFSTAMGIQNGVDGHSAAVGLVSAFGFVAATCGLAALIAWSVQWVLGLKQKHAAYKDLLSTVMVSFAPLALASLLGMIYVIAAGGRMGDFTAGALLFLRVLENIGSAGF